MSKIKQYIKKNRMLYNTAVNTVETAYRFKNRIVWDFWHKYANIALRLGNLYKTQYVPVLYFHWFVKAEDKMSIEKYSSIRWYAAIEDFEQQILWIKRRGYHFLTADEYYDWYRGERNIPRKSVLLTFDDGERSLSEMVVPILKKYGVPALFFVIGKRVLEDRAAKLPETAIEDQVEFFGRKELDYLKDNDLITIGSHTYNMHFMVDGVAAAHYYDDEDIDRDFAIMDERFDFNYFAAPFGEYNDCIYENVKNHHKMGFTVETAGCPYSKRGEDIYKIRRIRIDGMTKINHLKSTL